MATPKIIAVIGEADLSHPYFNHLSADDKDEIHDAIERGISIPITFLNEHNEPVFFSAFDPNDFYKDGLHVHLLVGKFLKFYKFIDVFYQGLARYLGKNSVTFCTKKRAIFNLGQMMGYQINGYGDLEKRIG